MSNILYKDAQEIIKAALLSAQPDVAVTKAIKECPWLCDGGRIVLIAIGKAAWQMAKVAIENVGDFITGGVVITKYEHSMGDLPGVTIYEAGHPIPDANSFAATEAAIQAAQGLTAKDRVLLLISGGGSALFEKPLVPVSELESITQQLLACGADIVEMNTIRKRLSAVKGGRFAQLCAPAKVFSIVLSDIIGDPLDMIASGPAYPDSSTCEAAFAIAQKYNIIRLPETDKLMAVETPKSLNNVTTNISGSVRQLCFSAQDKCIQLGYSPTILTDSLNCTARDAGTFMASIARFYQDSSRSLAFLAGGETVVKLIGTGKGGRNQELALSAAVGIDGLADTAVFSFGSDGTDGPTDAAGGYVDGATRQLLKEIGVDIHKYLENNDSYRALDSVNALLKTGPTGTNVNDLSVVLIRR